MKIFKILIILVVIFLSSTSTILAVVARNLPCIPNPELGIDGGCGGEYLPQSEPADLFTTENIFLLFVPLVLSAILSILIYRRNKKDKELGLERLQFTIWSNLLFGILMFNTYFFTISQILNNIDLPDNFLAPFILFILYLSGFLFSHYTALLFKNIKNHKVMFTIMLALSLFMLWSNFNEIFYFF